MITSIYGFAPRWEFVMMLEALPDMDMGGRNMRIAVIMRAVLYGVVLLMMLILMIIARRESIFSEEEISPVLVPFRRAAVHLYKGMLRRRARNRRAGHVRNLLLSEQARTDLATMDASGRLGRRTASYAIDKVMLLLACMTAAAALGLMLLFKGQQDPILQGEAIARPTYGAGDTTVRLSGKADGEEAEYEITIRERQYTSKETQALFEELEAVLPARILGENKSLTQVQSDLELPSSYEGYPFRLTYSSSNYAYLHDDGTVCNEELEDGECVDVVLTVKAAYAGITYRTEIPVTLIPVPLTQVERFADAVQSALMQADADTIYGGTFYLPEWVDGTLMEWSEPVQDQSLALFLLILFAGAVLCYIKDRQLREQVEHRERQMTIDYPQVVSKVTLFLGAGMSVRNIWYKLGEDYARSRDNGGEVHYVYEEIQLMCRELDSGTPEIAAYRNLAARCRLRPYTKFISLLTQNLQKGNSALLGALEDEAAAAFEERKNIARQMGEEAGTKMLLPMMLMLIITLVIIVVPAYLGFS